MQPVISLRQPACFFFLNQSASMEDPFGGESGRSKAQSVVDAINRFLFELVIICAQTGGDIKNRFDTGVIGYGQRVGPALSGSLSGRYLIPIPEIANNPIRKEEKYKKIDDGTGTLIEVKLKVPVWLDPVAQNDKPMCEAFRKTESIIDHWIREHPDSFPPIVINITDGEATDGDPLKPSEELRKLATSDGNLLLFNAYLSSHIGSPISYPESESKLQDEYSRQLFGMSSVIPPSIQKSMKQMGYIIGEKSRGFIFNSDPIEIILSLRR